MIIQDLGDYYAYFFKAKAQTKRLQSLVPGYKKVSEFTQQASKELLIRFQRITIFLKI